MSIWTALVATTQKMQKLNGIHQTLRIIMKMAEMEDTAYTFG